MPRTLAGGRGLGLVAYGVLARAATIVATRWWDFWTS